MPDDVRPSEEPQVPDGVDSDDESSPFGGEGTADEVGLQRLREALFRPSRAQVVVGVLLAALGFAAITQVRTNNTDNTYAGYREQDLVDVLSGLADTSQRAQREINQLEVSRRRLEQNRQAQSAAIAAAQKQAQELNILAGLVPVTGPGIRLTVTEGPRPVDVDSVLDTIEELRSAGAEAMQVNGQIRLVAQSSVQSAPGGLEIDGTLVHSPYVVDAIGDPHTLNGALNLVDGPVAQFKDAGATVEIDQRDSLDITAVRQASTPQYAQPQ
jgi:uncharacterized protein YlxW (UPF0749 family)